jgi:hypothetical protein
MSTRREELPDLPAFHPRRPGLIRPVPIDPSGANGPTRGQSIGPRWRRTSRGLFVPAEVERTPEQRLVEAGALLPEHGAITGWGALHWQGAQWLTGSTPTDPHGLPVDISIFRHQIRQQSGIRLCEERCSLDDRGEVDGLQVCFPTPAAVFAMRYSESFRDAVRVFCMAAYDDLVSVDELTAYAGLAPRLGLSSWTGMPRYRDAMDYVSENVWSPQEVTMMLIWMVDAGLPRPLMNQPIFDRDGRHLATPDLLDVEAGAIGEYNGAVHLVGAQPAKDRRREELLRDHDLESFTMMAGDGADRDAMAQRMVATRRRARWQAESERSWTIEQPSWWRPTETVAQRRALSEDERRYLLANRRRAA